MTITTRWNKLFDWRHASTELTDALDHIPTDRCTLIMSARAFGLKGFVPGARHSYIVTQHDTSEWIVTEISDLETLQYQNGDLIWAEYEDPKKLQIVVSNRDPREMWFGNKPRVDAILPFRMLGDSVMTYNYSSEGDLLTYNCNTFVSYFVWMNEWDVCLPYIGWRDSDYWLDINGAI